MSVFQFKIPKFKRAQQVTTPDGRGYITGLKYVLGKTWYEINGKYYAESEIHP